MKLADRFKTFSALTALACLVSPAAMAHPGHTANATVHSLLHAEHIIALVFTGMAAFILFALRKK